MSNLYDAVMLLNRILTIIKGKTTEERSDKNKLEKIDEIITKYIHG